MSAVILDLTRRLSLTQPTCGCTRHMFEAVIERAQTRLDASSSLLVGRDDLETVLADLRSTLESVLSSTAPEVKR
jgi:hypothetical protein